jgi:hypothetical protein
MFSRLWIVAAVLASTAHIARAVSGAATDSATPIARAPCLCDAKTARAATLQNAKKLATRTQSARHSGRTAVLAL